ncbi:MAG: right-handed parallel beta-helix repeat-containing protein [Candidatus Krumholzibacteria bacterium]|nr:right-handed parallel beta-helix repeat-containing protein [Candidatus Krumholzibacteria bacterium]
MRSHLFPMLATALTIISTLALATSPVLAEKSEDERIAEINKRNAELGYQWTAGKTSVSGLSAEEKKQLLGLLPLPEGWGKDKQPLMAPAGAVFVSSYDWRQHNGVTPVTNQRSCGSCWAFAAVAQLESHTLIFDERLEDLSEQQVVDCNPWGGDCGGGWVPGALDLFMDPGCEGELCYPYEARDDKPCRQDQCEVLSMISDYAPVANNVDAIKTALQTGPVSTAFTVIDDFYNYTSGCYQSTSTANINHAMLIIGWDDNACAGQGAWIVKNSWGQGWGMAGFGYIKYGSCNIGSYAYQITYLPTTVKVHLDSPVGGEVWNVGEQHDITWNTSRQTPDSLNIFLSLDGGETYDHTIAHGLAGTTTSYGWIVPNLPVSTARIKVIAYYGGKNAGYDMSDTNFMIKGAPYRYVSKSGGNVFPYSLPEWASTTIQGAVSAGVPGDTIIVAGDTYNQSITVEAPVYLYGGWNSDFTVRDPETYVTRIQAGGSLVTFLNVASDSCGIEGFALRYGSGTFLPMPANGVYGGAILSYQSSPVIRNNLIDSCGVASVLDYSGGGGIACYGGTALIEGNRIEACLAQSGGGIYLYQTTATIRGNRIAGCRPNLEYNGTRHGGGIYALHSTVTLEGNTIKDNDDYRKGSGVYLFLSPATLEGDTIVLNDGTDAGAGICADRSSLSLSRAVVRQNTTPSSGGGIYLHAGSIDISNCIVALNRSNVIGGGMYADSCWGAVTNNTFDRNHAVYGGGNVFLAPNPSLAIKNNLFSYGAKNGFQTNSLNNITFKFNNCFGNTPLNVVAPGADATNISRNPHYADTTSFDYHLLAHSGGIDTGDPAGPADPDGSRVDQGAFGGPGALMAAPEYVKWLDANPAPANPDYYLVWGAVPGDVTSYAVYSDTATGFAPDTTNFLASVGAPTCFLFVSPPPGLHFYRVSAVNAAGYGGGYSNEIGVRIWEFTPIATVVYPNGGEIFEVGDTILVQWTVTGGDDADSVSIYYSDDAGDTYKRLAHGWPADSSYQWVIPPSLSDSCLVKILAFDLGILAALDESDSLFAIRNKTGVGDEGEDDGGVPPIFVTALEQNYPNPFNGTTLMFYSIGERCEVEIKIYDPAGRVIKVLERAQREPGRYSILWNGSDGAGRSVASGVYFCRIKAGKYTQTRKILYLR